MASPGMSDRPVGGGRGAEETPSNQHRLVFRAFHVYLNAEKIGFYGNRSGVLCGFENLQIQRSCVGYFFVLRQTNKNTFCQF